MAKIYKYKGAAPEGGCRPPLDLADRTRDGYGDKLAAAEAALAHHRNNHVGCSLRCDDRTRLRAAAEMAHYWYQYWMRRETSAAHPYTEYRRLKAPIGHHCDRFCAHPVERDVPAPEAPAPTPAAPAPTPQPAKGKGAARLAALHARLRVREIDARR